MDDNGLDISIAELRTSGYDLCVIGDRGHSDVLDLCPVPENNHKRHSGSHREVIV